MAAVETSDAAATFADRDSQDNISMSPSKFSSVFFARVTKSFPTISIFSDKAIGIYNSVKELNPVLKNGLETAEHKLDEKVTSYHDVLVRVDSFGVRQLDKVEELAHNHPLESLKSVNKTQVLSCVNNVISEKIVIPASAMISGRINQALTITERTVDTYVPAEQTKKETNSEDLQPTVRVRNLTSRVSNHVKNRVLNNLQNSTIRMRSQQKVDELKVHTVDLIKYFNENIATQPKNFVVAVQKKSAEKKEVIINNTRKALTSAQTKAAEVKKQVTARISRDVLALSNIVTENLNTIRISEHLTPYILYVSSFVSDLRNSTPSAADKEKTKNTQVALSAVEEKLHHIEFKFNKHSDGSSSFEVFLPLPSYSQIRFLLSQQTLKLAVERMLELIAKTQSLAAIGRRSTVVVEPVEDD